MNAEMVARTIELIVAPAVMVSACAILQGGLLGHYAAINDRLRSLTREHLELLGARDQDEVRAAGYHSERLEEINVVLPDLLQRHKLARDAILFIYGAICAFVVNMVLIAVAVASASSWIAVLTLVMFIAATLVLLWGLLMVAVEIRMSHRAVQFEVERMLRLNQIRDRSDESIRFGEDTPKSSKIL